nr:replication protein a 70 kda dna-binding subunit b [Quercus suber]
MSIRRKSNNDTTPKCDITIADETKKTIVVSLWNDLATSVGQELLDIADKSPIVAIKSLKVGKFQGMILKVNKVQWHLSVLISKSPTQAPAPKASAPSPTVRKTPVPAPSPTVVNSPPSLPSASSKALVSPPSSISTPAEAPGLAQSGTILDKVGFVAGSAGFGFAAGSARFAVGSVRRICSMPFWI